MCRVSRQDGLHPGEERRPLGEQLQLFEQRQSRAELFGQLVF
jgi:hypothetical protein